MSSPEEILAEIESLWFSSRRAYRDARLRVGTLLDLYLVAKARCPTPGPRENVVADLARRLSISRNRVYELVNVAKAVELLGAGVDLGGTSYAVLSVFRKFVYRVKETWSLRSFPGLDGSELLRRAVVEKWTVEVCRCELMPARPTSRPGPYRSPTGTNVGTGSNAAPVSLLASAKAGTPRDVAELVLRLIAASGDPLLVSRLVADSLLAGAK